MTMKKTFKLPLFIQELLLAAIGFALICITPIGCATTGSNPKLPVTEDQQRHAAQAATVVETSAQLGTYYAVRQDANARAYFEAADVVLGILINSGTFEPKSVQDALKNISVRELRSEEVSLAVAAAVALYGNFFGEAVTAKLDQNVYVKPVLVALRNGIVRGLGTTSTERTFNLPPRS